MVENLEEIFWIKGKWLDKEAIELHPESIGLPKSVELSVSNEEYNQIKLSTLIKNPNNKRLGYSLECKQVGNDYKTTAVQFYKI
jgi:hypothetical protein